MGSKRGFRYFRLLAAGAACLTIGMVSGGEAKAFTSTSAGYVCVDSEEVPPTTTPQTIFPPLFQWDDISQNGNQINPGVDGTVFFGIAWNFNYMGTFTNQVSVNANGFITIPSVQTFPGNVNTAIPNAAQPNNSVYGFWDDLNPPLGFRWLQVGTIVGSRRWVWQWTQCPHINGAAYANVTFQITLFEANGANAILLQYLTMTGTAGDGRDATVGIENNIGSAGIQYSFGNGATVNPAANNLYNGLAVGFYPTGATPPWNSVLPPPAGGGGGGGGGAPPPTVNDPDGDGEDDDRKHNRCTGDAGAGGAGAACLVTLASLFALALARRAA